MLDNPAHKTPTAYKLVTLLPTEKVLGVHIIGEGSDEIMQFVGVAVKMGATKKDLDDTVAIRAFPLLLFICLLSPFLSTFGLTSSLLPTATIFHRPHQRGRVRLPSLLLPPCTLAVSIKLTPNPPLSSRLVTMR